MHAFATSSPWPEDLAFKRLAREIRNGVTYAINSGLKISARRGIDCYCPLGAALLLSSGRQASHPGAPLFVSVLSRRVALFDSNTVIPDERMVWAFIGAFEQGMVSTSLVVPVEASSRLGIWYRTQFLGESEARHPAPGQKLTKSKPAR